MCGRGEVLLLGLLERVLGDWRVGDQVLGLRFAVVIRGILGVFLWGLGAAIGDFCKVCF